MSSISSPSRAPRPADLLDTEIQKVRDQIKALSSRRKTLASALLSSPQLTAIAASQTPSGFLPPAELKSLLDRAKRQSYDRLLSSHRLASSTTLFSTRDPDPHAIGNGEVTGIRIEIYSRQKRTFLTPAYVFLNQPWRQMDGDEAEAGEEDRERYRVHRHTLPACIPLAALSARYIPPPPVENDGGSVKGAKRQDLQAFARAVRKEVVGLQRRRDAIEGAVEQNIGKRNGLKSIGAVNAEITDLRMEWGGDADVVARVRVGKDGVVKKAVVNGESGARYLEVERKILGVGRVESLGEVQL